MNRWIQAGLTLCLLAVPGIAAADEITLEANRDNTLYETIDGSLSNGAGAYFFAGSTIEGELRRGLVHFDLSAIPSGSTIDSAVLTLNMSRTIAGPTPVTLHRLTADWGEGTSDAAGEEGAGAISTPGDATWIHTFFDGQFWSVAGGDFAATDSALTVVDAEGLYSWGPTAEMIADVAVWVDDASQNFGWLVQGEELARGQQGASAKRFDSRQVGGAGMSTGPQLVVTFTPPVPVELQSFAVDPD